MRRIYPSTADQLARSGPIDRRRRADQSNILNNVGSSFAYSSAWYDSGLPGATTIRHPRGLQCFPSRRNYRSRRGWLLDYPLVPQDLLHPRRNRRTVLLRQCDRRRRISAKKDKLAAGYKPARFRPRPGHGRERAATPILNQAFEKNRGITANLLHLSFVRIM
jgi:hypothetical protein